ncbi:MAG: hypothetical protein F9K32_08695 [Desulfobulbaceae bacterium]|nr:MAG: hypothetical protein F9K32_08695 [Desulfobulbaceae bacterium]
MNKLYAMRISEIWNYVEKQDLLFWLINLYLFFEYVRPQTLYRALDILPYAQIIILLTLALATIRGTLGKVSNPLNKLIVLYFLVILASSVQALSPETSYSKLSEFISWMIIYFLIVNIINTESRFLIFILAFMIYSFKMSQFSFRNWIASGFGFVGIGTGGGPGWFHNSGEFGIQMVIFFSFGACFFWALKKHWPRWKQAVFFLFPLTALTGTVSSSSRGAVLGVAGVIAFWMLKSRYKIRGILLAGVLAIIVFAIIPPEQKARFEAMGNDDTSTSRIEYWKRGLELIERYPVLGVGHENWLVAQEKVFGIENSEISHNIFIQCAADLGYTGFSVLLLLIFFTFRNNYNVRRIIRDSRRDNDFLFFMSHALDGALVGYMVSGFFVTVLYYPYFWINLAMTASLREATRVWASSNSTIQAS